MSGIRYLALGDSYTIGEGVARHERWPEQLVSALREHGYPMAEPDVVAQTGWTCDELAAGIAGAALRGPYALVSVLVGVNDQYRGKTPDEYRPRFEAVLAVAQSLAGERTGRVVVLSIPDWGVSPFAPERGRAEIAREIDAFNAVNHAVAARAGARYVDITASSRAAVDRSCFVADGLHPAASVHAEWARLAVDAAERALRV